MAIMDDLLLLSGGGGGGIDNRIAAYNLTSPHRKQEFSVPTGQDILQSLVYSPDLGLLFAVSDAMVLVFRKDDKLFLKQIKRFRADFHSGRDSALNFVRLSPRGIVIATGGDEGVIRIFAVKKQGDSRLIKQFKQGSPVLNAQFHSSEGLMVANSKDKIFLYDMLTIERRMTFQASPDHNLSLALFSPITTQLLLVEYRKKGGLCYIQNINASTGKTTHGPQYLAKTMVSAHSWVDDMLALGTCQGEVVAYDCARRGVGYTATGHDEMIIKGLECRRHGQAYQMFSGAPNMTMQERSFKMDFQHRPLYLLVVMVVVAWLVTVWANEARIVQPLYY